MQYSAPDGGDVPTNKSVKEWYLKHADVYNAERRARYAGDPEQREIAAVRAREYREKRAQGVEIKRILHRTEGAYDGIVYSTGQVAEYIGKSARCLRNWHKKTWLPATVFGGKHRLYTQTQVGLIKKLSDFIDQEGVGWSITKDELVQQIFKEW